MNCLFCRIAQHEIPAEMVYEDRDHVAFLDIHPQDTGHVLIISKTHYPNLFSMPEEAYLEIWKVVRRVEAGLRQASQAERVFVRVIGTEVDHVHIHLLPQTFADITDKTNLVAVKERIIGILQS
jgi:histidine triad (HIT) family protein